MTEFQSLILKAIISSLLGQKLIVRKSDDRLILAQPPTFREPMVATKAQKKVRNKFTAAAKYARKALADPKLKERYKEKATQTTSAFNVAFKDYLRPPEVQKIEADAYTGKPGSTISIKAKDDFDIKEVEVRIFNADGDLIEKGKTIKDPILKIRWIYTSKIEISKLPGCKIKAVAKDFAGNKGELEIIL